MLNDIKNAFDADSNGSYFIGNIVVSHDKEDKIDKAKKEFVLIDGQQRLTALFLIGFYLAFKKCDDWQDFILQGNELRISMPCRNAEQEALENLAKNITDFENLKDKLVDNFKNALKHIIEWFSENIENDTTKLNNFANFIYSKVKFVFVKLAQGTDLNRFFVRMNNRGKQLEKHEILKARLLKQIFDGDNTDNKCEYHTCAKIWDLCSDMNKYIFKGADDRKIFENQETKDNNKSEQESQTKDTTTLYGIIDIFTLPPKTKNQAQGNSENYKSIVDFPTFLLHVFKIFSENKADYDVKINKDDLLKEMWESKGDENARDLLYKADKAKNFIESLLFYRVLFDYFVIKEQIGADSKERYKIRKLAKRKDGENIYFIIATEKKSKKESNSESDKDVYPNLSMIQNYLRVARAGDSQNYHHWLTPFLKYLGTLHNVLQDDTISKIQSWLENCKKGETTDIEQIVIASAEKQSKEEKEKEVEKQKEALLVNFLENLDTTLACEQYKIETKQSNTADLLAIANSYPQEQKIQNNNNNSIAKDNWEFLDKGTGSPHYWFYRLEYYLWKWQENKDLIFAGANNQENLSGDFKKIVENFYFRNLNSIEHIQPQSKASDWKDKEGKEQSIDMFGNLALISVGFNSSLSNQEAGKDKLHDLIKKVNKGDVESLKLWIVYYQYIIQNGDIKNPTWDYGKAETHKKHMLEILKKSFVPTITAQPNQTQNP